MSLLNPLAKLTPIGTDPGPQGVPSISNTRSRAEVVDPVAGDLAYIRSLGPGPLPWEEPSKAMDPTIRPGSKPPTVGLA